MNNKELTIELSIENEEEPMMTEDEYDAYLHREPIDGGPSLADELLSSEFRK